VSGHVGDDDLLGIGFPETADRITHIPAALKMPVGGISLTLPVEIKLIFTAIAGVIVIQVGLVEKLSRPRAPFFQALDHFKPQINSPFCNINILNLPDQIQNECVWSSSQGNWGLVENNSTSYCESLVSTMGECLRLRQSGHSPIATRRIPWNNSDSTRGRSQHRRKDNYCIGNLPNYRTGGCPLPINWSNTSVTSSSI
jgi:hypothetical protein